MRVPADIYTVVHGLIVSFDETGTLPRTVTLPSHNVGCSTGPSQSITTSLGCSLLTLLTLLLLSRSCSSEPQATRLSTIKPAQTFFPIPCQKTLCILFLLRTKIRSQ